MSSSRRGTRSGAKSTQRTAKAPSRTKSTQRRTRSAPQRRARTSPRIGRPYQPFWADWSDRKLLELRLCDLGVQLEGSWLQEPIEALYDELGQKNLLVKPHFWLSSEWFCPAGVPGVAIPFYLAHPRLMQLERRQMLEVEGGTRKECLKLLRHETGHAVQHAFNLHRRRAWQQTFGKSSTPYPEYYRPNPASKRFVVHLELFYAQSHPDEDFAETFAVWLRPRSSWKKVYRQWPALKKLEYVDELMSELAGTRPPVTIREKQEPLHKLTQTLGEYYTEKRAWYGTSKPDAYDKELMGIFTEARLAPHAEPAATFLRRHQREIRRMVARWTGEYQVTLDAVLSDMIANCRRLKLRAFGSEEQLKMDFSLLLTVKTMHYVFRGREWHPL